MMKTIVIALNLIGAVLGLVAAWLWHKSAKTDLPVRDSLTGKFVHRKTREPLGLSMGDLGVTVVEGAAISRQAAAWTAAATFIMAIATILGAVAPINKHVQPQTQERRNSPESTTMLGNPIQMEEGACIGRLLINGVLANPAGPLVNTDTRSAAEIERELSLPIPVTREYKWVKSVLKDGGFDVLELMQKAHQRISQFTAEIYTI
jgi:hypothetical protein